MEYLAQLPSLLLLLLPEIEGFNLYQVYHRWIWLIFLFWQRLVLCLIF